jgi:hypothetical protein
MTVQEERPPQGNWQGNALVHERSRVRCLNEAEKVEGEGHPEEAAQYRELAAQAKAQRDRAHAEGLRRQMNRHIGAQRRWR